MHSESDDQHTLADASSKITNIDIIQELARGGFCDVQVALDRNTGDNIVLKRFEDSMRGDSSFEREVEVFEILQMESIPENNFIIAMQWFDTEEKIIALEFCDGGDLYDLASQECLLECDVIFYAAEIASAIGFLHVNNIFHGDIKPENVGITAQGHVRLFDFGLSYVLSPIEDVDPDSGRLIVNTSAGTLYYAAPEILKYRRCGLEADWWSFGVLLHELLFASIPWEGETKEDTARKISVEPLLWTSDQLNCASLDAIFMLQGLLASKDAKLRLGYEDDFAEIKTQPFFSSIDWDKLQQQRLKPPFEVNVVY